MAHKVIVPQKKNYVPQFLKQRDINSYFEFEVCRKDVDLGEAKMAQKRNL